MQFICPLCKKPLTVEGGVARCPTGHAYDRAAEGYFHLLPPNRMHAKVPGDSKAMVASRRAFLEAGYYEPFCAGIAQTAARLLAGHKKPVVVDAGCGEGIYTARVAHSLPRAEVCGFDISKFAVKAAAKRYPGIDFAIASCFGIPLPDRCCDLLLSVFSPIVPEQFARLVRPGGYLLLAVPGPEHLFGLKELLYDRPYHNPVNDTAYPGFTLVERVELPHHIVLDDPIQLQNLFAMTPYYWKTSKEGSARLQAATRLETDLQFDLVVYRRNG